MTDFLGASNRRRPSRRQFLQSSAGAAVGALLPVPAVHGGRTDALRVGLVGCGRRGTLMAAQALAADPDVKLVAAGDVFADRLEDGLKALEADAEVGSQVNVPKDRRFVGFEAYKGVLAESDVVFLCTPPHFRPLHLEAAVAAGKHVFAEKPVAVDAPGVRRCLAACEAARGKGLSVVAGLQLRRAKAFREVMKRLHEGAIGEIVAVQANDYRGGRRSLGRQPGWTDMEYHLRNWYNFTWLSGDFNVEQHVHFLDVCAWAMNGASPERATGMGGRQVLTGPEYGHIYDHFSVVYEFATGVRLYSNCRQQRDCKNEIAAHVLGTQGRATLSETQIVVTGPAPWEHRGLGNLPNRTQFEELFASIRDGKPVNDGEIVSRSTLLAILGRMSAYTGQQITWQQALDSREDLSPAKYTWDTPLETPAVPMPGRTRFF